jgi:hypothetical protein
MVIDVEQNQPIKENRIFDYSINSYLSKDGFNIKIILFIKKSITLKYKFDKIKKRKLLKYLI